MKKRTLICFAAAFLLFGAAASYAFVAPALPWLGEIAVTALESFAIRSAGRQVITTVGVAANDATWASKWLSWFNAARSVATISFTGLNKQNETVTYEVALDSTHENDLTRAPFTRKLFYTAPGMSLPWQFTITQQVVPVPYMSSTNAEELGQMYANWHNTQVLSANQLTLVPPCSLHENPSILSVTCSYSWPASTYNTSETFLYKKSEEKDGVVRIIGERGYWYPDGTDPDLTPADAQALTEGSLKLKAVNQQSDLLIYPEGNNLHVTARSMVDTQRVNVKDVILDAQAIPQTVTESTAPGNLTDTATNPDPGTGTGTGTGTNTTTFPSDYARQGEVNAGVDKLLFTGNPPPLDPSVSSTWTDFGNTFNSLTAWTLPGHSSVCPTSSFTAFDKSFTFDAHCQLINDHFALLSNAMVVVWSIAALFIVLRA